MDCNLAEMPLKKARGLDVIRFFCALWVFFGHGAAPQIELPYVDDFVVQWFVRGVRNNIWCAPAAVMVFLLYRDFVFIFRSLSLSKSCISRFFTLGALFVFSFR